MFCLILPNYFQCFATGLSVCSVIPCTLRYPTEWKVILPTYSTHLFRRSVGMRAQMSQLSQMACLSLMARLSRKSLMTSIAPKSLASHGLRPPMYCPCKSRTLQLIPFSVPHSRRLVAMSVAKSVMSVMSVMMPSNDGL